MCEHRSLTAPFPAVRSSCRAGGLLMFLVLAALLSAGLPPGASGKEIRLAPGERTTVGDTTVTCAAAAAAPMELRSCQHWDKFNRTCLYEKRTLVAGGARCEDSCQVWDGFNGVCLYEARCRFIPGENAFVRTTCADFDRFDKVCRREKEALIR